MEGIVDSKPCVKFEVEKVIGISADGTYQVQWAPAWVSKFHLVGCEHLIQEFLEEQDEIMGLESRTQFESGTLSNCENPVKGLPLQSENVIKLEPEVLESDQLTENQQNQRWENLESFSPQSNHQYSLQPIPFVEIKEETDLGSGTEDVPTSKDGLVTSFYPNEPRSGNASKEEIGQHHNPSAYSELYSCEECGDSFSRKRSLTAHMLTHSKDKPFGCDICNKSFTTRGGLKSHKYIHTGEKPYACTFCESRFTMSCNLRRHLNTHTGEKTYQCDLCRKSFSDQSNFNRHKLIHTRQNGAKGVGRQSSVS